MDVMAFGLNMAGEPLVEPQPEEVVADALIAALGRNAESVKGTADVTRRGAAFRGEQERLVVDEGNPRTAGWTYLVHADDPDRGAIADALADLVEHRGMAEPDEPLLYNGEAPHEWLTWMEDNWHALDFGPGNRPQYILIVGGPDRIPLGFQSLLDVSANVGRVAFDSIDDLGVYADKLCRLERADAPVTERSALFYGTDDGYPDPTYYSRKYMIDPLVASVRAEHEFEIRSITGGDATKANLAGALATTRPSLVYTASHGLGAFDASPDLQRRYNGSICCSTGGGPLTVDQLFSAGDVPTDPSEPFLEGVVFFQFACFGYGTPAASEFAAWTDEVPAGYGDADFLAALPPRLLAHPRGPIAYIGHVDVAFLHGFTDADDPDILDPWHNRMVPFKSAVDRLLGVQPGGLAMRDLNLRYSSINAVLTSTQSRIERGKMQWTPETKSAFVEQWIMRGDAQNFLIFGDPAARLRIPA